MKKVLPVLFLVFNLISWVSGFCHLSGQVKAVEGNKLEAIARFANTDLNIPITLPAIISQPTWSKLYYTPYKPTTKNNLQIVI